MKTFQTAIATSLHFLKLPIILLALFFNFSIGGPLPNPIGGIGGLETRRFAINDGGIGGSQTVPRPFKGNETKEISSSFAYTVHIGGNGGSVPPRTLSKEVLTAGIEIPIGGQQGAPRQLKSEIGGNNGPVGPRNLVQTGSLDIASIEVPIGGTQNPPRRLFEIGGGQFPPKSVFVATAVSSSFIEFPIGGQSTPRPCAEIGGGQLPPREIGGPQETRKFADIGGQQTAPRSIGGGQPLAPREIGIEIGGNSCPRCGSLNVS